MRERIPSKRRHRTRNRHDVRYGGALKGKPAEIENFFGTYKLLEHKDTRIEGWKGAEAALEVLKKYSLRSGQ